LFLARVREGGIRDSELVRRGDDRYAHLVGKRSVTVADEYDDILAIDTCARWITTRAFLSDRKTILYGEEVRRIREHYNRLRKSIGKAKPRQTTLSAYSSEPSSRSETSLVGGPAVHGE
jgi:putative transposase